MGCFGLQDVDEREEEIRLMREELTEAEQREKEAADALKASRRAVDGTCLPATVLSDVEAKPH